MAKVSVTLDIGEGVDPFSVRTSRPKRSQVREYRALLKKLISGDSSRVTSRPTLRVGTAQASCTATLVTPVTGNHVDINAKACTAAQLHARGLVTFSTVIATNAVAINGINFVGTAGAVVLGAATFSVDTSDTAAAASLAAQINGHPSCIGVVGAVASGATVKIRATATGTAGNAIAFAKTGSPVTIQTAAAGSLAGAFIEGGAAPSGDQWDYGDTDTQAATSLAACINRSTTALITGVAEATSALGVVTIKAATKGLSGNAIAVAKTGAPITLAGVTSGLMTGGTSTTFTF